MSRNLTVVGLCLLASVAIAHADVSDVVFRVDASNGTGAGFIEITEDQGEWLPDGDDMKYIWVLEQPMDIVDPVSRSVIATLIPGSGGDATGVEIQQDPVVNLGFAVQAGAADTMFSFSSAKLTFPSIASAEGRAQAAFNLTDSDGSGPDPGNGVYATLTGQFPAGDAYRAQYNGFPVGTTFQEMIQPYSADFFSSAPSNEEHPNGGGFIPIPGVVTDMSAQISFELSAFDLASGTTTFEVIPEPAALALFAVAGLLLRRR